MFRHYANNLSCDMTEAYSEHCQTSKMESFAKIVNGFQFDKVILTRL